jgi:hypothetical protein
LVSTEARMTIAANPDCNQQTNPTVAFMNQTN